MPSLVQQPFPIFTDNDGDPLESGSIYIGVANLNPIANPINAYWDAALTIPAVQPIKTKGGFPARSGTPARIYVPTNYSILVQNKNGTLINSILDAVDYFNASSGDSLHKVSTIASLRLLVPTDTGYTVQVAGYYAPGDGGGGPLRYWDAASVAADDGGAVIRPTTIAVGDPGRWLIERVTDVSVLWWGCKGDGLADQQDTKINLATAYAATIGARVYVPGGTYLIKNVIWQHSNQTIYGDGPSSILKRSSDLSTLYVGIIANINTYIGGVYQLANAIAFNLDVGLTLRDITLDGNNDAIPNNSFGVVYLGVTDCTIDHVYATDCGLQALLIRSGRACRVTNCTVFDTAFDGIHVEDCIDYVIDSNYVRAAADYGIETTAGVNLANALNYTGRGVISNNTVVDSPNFGICARGWFGATNPNNHPIRDVVIIGNTVEDVTLYGIGIQEWAQNISVIGNNIANCGVGIHYAGEGTGTALSSYLSITGNSIRDVTTGISMFASFNDSICSNFILRAIYGIVGSLTYSIIDSNLLEYIGDFSGTGVGYCFRVTNTLEVLISNNKTAHSDVQYTVDVGGVGGSSTDIFLTTNQFDNNANNANGALFHSVRNGKDYVSTNKDLRTSERLIGAEGATKGLTFENSASPGTYRAIILFDTVSSELWLRNPAFDDIGIYTGGTERLHITSFGTLYPTTDNIVSCGAAANRWSVVYAGTGAINTSDDREKLYLSVIDAEHAVAIELKGLMKKFKYRDAVEKKGENARIHFGASAQTVKATFEKHGLNADEYGMLCYDEWEASDEVKDADGNVIREAISAGNRYGLRYDELLSFIIGSAF